MRFGRLSGDISAAEQRLIKGEQRLIDFIHVVDSAHDEVFHDQVEAAAVAASSKYPK